MLTGPLRLSVPMYLSKIDRHATDFSYAPVYQTQKAFIICPDFTYSLEATKGVVQGVSPGALPISATFKFAARPVDLVANLSLSVAMIWLLKGVHCHMSNIV